MPGKAVSKQSRSANQTGGGPGRWWHTIDDGARLQCDLCPRACVLKDGDRGFCFVRQNIGRQMILTTYGLSSGFSVDPIEKKPLYHFLPGTTALSFGTAGCNLGCQFCQNWSISKSRQAAVLSQPASPDQVAKMAVQLKCASVAFTYNDPVIWAEYAIDTARACHRRGIRTVAVTSGYISPEARPEFFSVMDAVNVDLKAFSELFYRRLTLSHLKPVLNTLSWLRLSGKVWFEITNLLIPGENDSPQEGERMCRWIVENLGSDVPVHFTAFFPSFRLLDKPATPAAIVIRAREQALAAGIRYAYVGNIFDFERGYTYCAGCGQCLIERGYHQLAAYRLKGNRCSSCSEVIPGVFEEKRIGTGSQNGLPLGPVRLRT